MVNKSRPELKVIRLDEVPVLFTVHQKIEIAGILDDLLSRHPNWVGELSFGRVVIGWLVFILSTSDQRLNQVEDWVEQRRDV